MEQSVEGSAYPMKFVLSVLTALSWYALGEAGQAK